MADIVIAGYLGFENGGDEVILSVLCSEIRRRHPHVDITVLSVDPKGTRERCRVRSIHRYDMAAIMREFSRSRVFVFGGGSLLQDATSRRSLYYYLFLLRLARRFGMKTMLLANGLGPLLREGSRRRTAAVLEGVDVITLRDHSSAELLFALGVRRPRISVTADPVFLLARGGVLSTGGRHAVISVRHVRRAQTPERAVAALCRHVSEKYGLLPLLLPMQIPGDLEVLRRVAELAGVPVRIWDAPVSEASLSDIFDGAELTVGMRLHALIFSSVFGVPFVGIDYDPKVASFCREAGMPCVGMGGDETPLLRAADGVIAGRGRLSLAAASMAEAASERAYAGIGELLMLLGG